MDQLAAAAHTNVGLHAKAPLVTLAGLILLQVPHLILVLGGNRRADDLGIDNRDTGELHITLFQVHANQAKQLIAQIGAPHQMPELANGRLIRHQLLPQIDTDKLEHRTGIIQRFFSGRGRQLNQCWRK